MRTISTILVLLSLTACDAPPSVAPALEMTSCALSDERLSVAFKEPARARAYLRELKRRLKDKDPDAIREAADLIARIVECLPEQDRSQAKVKP